MQPTHVTRITHIIFITHIIYITLILKFFFEAYEKCFFNIYCFLYKKMVNKYYRKYKERLEARERYRNFF